MYLVHSLWIAPSETLFFFLLHWSLLSLVCLVCFSLDCSFLKESYFSRIVSFFQFRLDDLDVKGYSDLDKILDLSPDSIFAENDRSEDPGSLYADFVTLQEAAQKQMDSPDSYELDFSLTRQNYQCCGLTLWRDSVSNTFNISYTWTLLTCELLSRHVLHCKYIMYLSCFVDLIWSPSYLVHVRIHVSMNVWGISWKLNRPVGSFMERGGGGYGVQKGRKRFCLQKGVVILQFTKKF